ncbi:DUF108 domain-containing protein [Candidatus Woesearchaeota archaeon]|nr:DUF108 domain-containing protein [Candidatus Woesearchaeota archaeon]
MKVSIIGCGNIGKELARFIDCDEHFELVGLVDVDVQAVKDTQALLKKSAPRMAITEAVDAADLVVESADKSAVQEIVQLCAEKGKKVLVLSVGGLVGSPFLGRCSIYIPSGAIAGLDAIKAVRGTVQELTLTTTKPPQAFQGAPYINKMNLRLDRMKEKTILFQGNFREAIQWFPQNINVAASLYLTSNFENLQVTIIADPNATLNTHEIVCRGAFGAITLKTENKPSKNPRTSYLAVLSAISVLKSINESCTF